LTVANIVPTVSIYKKSGLGAETSALKNRKKASL